MNKESKEFLYNLLTAPSPTGFEQEIQKVVRKRMEPYADSITTDLHGNVIVAINPTAERRVMLAGHCDQIGFMVRHITKEGFLYVEALGGIDPGVVPGSHATIHTAKGPINGVFGRKAIHQQSADERAKMPLDLSKMWLDIGAKSKAEVEKLIEIGDPVTYALGVTELRNDLICSPGLDDKVGLFVAMEALRLASSKKLSVGLYAVSTVQEEVGLRGARTAAYAVDPEVGIAIDVTFATDNPGFDDSKSVPMKLNGGPGLSKGPNTNPVLEKMLTDTAKQHKIPYQISPSGRPLGTDANAMQISRAGVAAASIGIPNRYMHSQVEVCSLKDIENTAKLLAFFVAKINSRTSFIP